MDDIDIDGWMLWIGTLPALRTDAGEALVVLCLLAHTTILAGPGAAGGQQGLAVVPWGFKDP